MKFVKVLFPLLAAVGTLAAGAAAAGGSLQGEELRSNGTLVVTSITCTPAGGSVTFTDSGEALGPYPGTYEATVTATGGPLSGPAGDYQHGQLTSFVETFTITSGPTTIIGTKTLSQPLAGDFYCRRYQPDECEAFDVGVTSAVSGYGGTDYAATIGGAADYGTATTDVSASGPICGGDIWAQYSSFSEVFNQSLAPHGPVAAADCKDGGFVSYGTAFKNQGECVSFVEHAQKGA
jgi:hypothetical protein